MVHVTAVSHVFYSFVPIFGGKSKTRALHFAITLSDVISSDYKLHFT